MAKSPDFITKNNLDWLYNFINWSVASAILLFIFCLIDYFWGKDPITVKQGILIMLIGTPVLGLFHVLRIIIWNNMIKAWKRSKADPSD